MMTKTRKKSRVSASVKPASRAGRAHGVEAEGTPAWTFLTNHAHVLFCLAEDPEVRLRDVAVRVGITERAVQRIVSDLEEAGYVERSRVGRRNSYAVHPDRPLRHPIEAHREVKALFELALKGRRSKTAH
jgi:hypothetical protein